MARNNLRLKGLKSKSKRTNKFTNHDHFNFHQKWTISSRSVIENIFLTTQWSSSITNWKHQFMHFELTSHSCSIRIEKCSNTNSMKFSLVFWDNWFPSDGRTRLIVKQDFIIVDCTFYLHNIWWNKNTITLRKTILQESYVIWLVFILIQTIINTSQLKQNLVKSVWILMICFLGTLERFDTLEHISSRVLIHRFDKILS